MDLDILLSLPKDDVFVTSACFEEGMKVLTKNGYKKISEIRQNDKVLSHMGTWENVIFPTKRKYDGRMFEINVEGCFQNIKCTENHQFPTVTKKHGYLTKEIVWKEAKDLVDSDRILDAIDEDYLNIPYILVPEILYEYRFLQLTC